MAGFGLYYSACVNMKHPRNSVTSLHLGEFDGCVCRILNQRLPSSLPWRVMLNRWYGCGCKNSAAAHQARRYGCILPRSWSSACGRKTNQASELRDFGKDASQFCLITECWDEKLKLFLKWEIYTEKWQRAHQLTVLCTVSFSVPCRIQSVE